MHPSFEDRRTRPIASSPRSTTRLPAPRRRVGARARSRRRGRRRRPAPAPPHAAARGGGARGARRAGRRAPARHRAADARGDRRRRARAGSTPRHGRERMRRWARRCERLIVASPARRSSAPAARHRRGRCVLPNGFDPSASTRTVDRAPAGATPRRVAARLASGSAGSAATERDRAARRRRSCYVGRFTAVKRLPLLIGAFAGRARARRPRRPRWCCSAATRASGRASIRARRSRAPASHDVFLAGWHDHDELPELLRAADVLVAGVACASSSAWCSSRGWRAGCRRSRSTGTARRRSSGTARPAGWSPRRPGRRWRGALAAAIEDAGERGRGAPRAARDARERFSWPAIAGNVADVLRDAAATRGAAARRAVSVS